MCVRNGIMWAIPTVINTQAPSSLLAGGRFANYHAFDRLMWQAEQRLASILSLTLFPPGLGALVACIASFFQVISLWWCLSLPFHFAHWATAECDEKVAGWGNWVRCYMHFQFRIHLVFCYVSQYGQCDRLGIPSTRFNGSSFGAVYQGLVKDFITNVGRDRHVQILSKFGIHFLIHAVFCALLISFLFSEGGFTMPFMRIGEATNPGPTFDDERSDEFCLLSFNPTQILGKEADIVKWPLGIWGGSETSHTERAMTLTRNSLKRAGVSSVWSPNVPAMENIPGSLRGTASGTVLLSRLPIQPYPAFCSNEDLMSTSRFVDATVQLSTEVAAYCACLYGPVRGGSFANPEALFHALFSEAACRADCFKGPASIVGDFNIEIEDDPVWKWLRSRGWHDCAVLAESRFGWTPEPTSSGSTRRSFILVNGTLAEHLTLCRTFKPFLFNCHPILKAHFRWQTTLMPQIHWQLPTTTDGFIFDPGLMQEHAACYINKHLHHFDSAQIEGDTEHMLKHSCLACEEVLANSAVNVCGNLVRLLPTFRGKCRKALSVVRKPAAPRLHLGREGDIHFPISQPCNTLRRWIKQLRRLRSFQSQYRAWVVRPCTRAWMQLEDLWKAIYEAKGFPGGFCWWAFDVLHLFLPWSCPNDSNVNEIAVALRGVVDLKVKEANATRYKTRRTKLLADIANGGRQAFQTVKDLAVPPVEFVAFQLQIPVARQRWCKCGNSSIILEAVPDKFDDNLPIIFQGQQSLILRREGCTLFLQTPVVCKAGMPLVAIQRVLTAQNSQMQEMISASWGELWNREPPNDSRANWQDAIQTLECLPDVQAFSPTQFTDERWDNMLKRVPKRSARGADAFTPAELKILPPDLKAWLFRMFDTIELTGQWPSRLTSAKVVMLSKGDSPATSPLDCRPITILSRLYRCWAKLRSEEVISQLVSVVHSGVSGAASGLSADMVIARTLIVVDEATEDGCEVFGLVVDLVKCFNRIPRIPLLVALMLMGIPVAYLRALEGMLDDVARYAELSHQIGQPIRSTCGFPRAVRSALLSCLC